MKSLKVFIILAILPLFVACAHHKKPQTYLDTASDTLQTLGIVYDTTMNGAVDLYANEQLSDEEFNEVLEIAQIYYDSYHSAVDAYEGYRNYQMGVTEEMTTKAQVMTAIQNAQRVWDNVRDRLLQYLPESKIGEM